MKQPWRIWEHSKQDSVKNCRYNPMKRKLNKTVHILRGLHCTSVSVCSGIDTNSLAHWRSYCDFKNVILNLDLLIGIFKSSYDNILRWMPQDLTDDESALIQVMAWCRQATSHYLSQCWPRSLSPYGVTRPQWANIFLYSLTPRSSWWTLSLNHKPAPNIQQPFT